MSLNRQQLTKVERKLDETYRTLLAAVRDELAATDNQQYVELINGDPADAGDASVGDLLADLNLAFIDRHIGNIRDIEAARKRIKDGTFEECVECGEDIGVERLLANPTAKRCVRCQQMHERVYAHEGTPTL